jgi:hypothetical protein
MGFSHRDHRTHRTIRRGTLAVIVSVVALTVVAVVIPEHLIGLVAVAALGILGGAYALHAHRLVESYLDDVERVRSGEPLPPTVRVEAGGDIGLDRRMVGPTTRSPHARRPVARTGDDGAEEGDGAAERPTA